MSKKQQYTTKFYEGNGGVIDAVTRDESGKVVNVLSGFEADPGTGLPLLNSSSHLPGKVRAGRKKFYAND